MDRQAKTFEALQIDITLATELVLNRPIHFDAWLMALAIEKSRNQYDSIQYDFPLPIRKVSNDGFEFYDCSDSIVSVIKKSMNHVIRRFNLESINRNNVNVAGLEFCSKCDPFEINQVEFVRFFAYGNRAEIESLILPQIGSGHLGIYRAKGFGLISGVSISPVDMKYCCLDTMSGIALRNIPTALNQIDLLKHNCQFSVGRYNPPYYNFSENRNGNCGLLKSGGNVRQYVNISS